MRDGRPYGLRNPVQQELQKAADEAAKAIAETKAMYDKENEAVRKILDVPLNRLYNDIQELRRIATERREHPDRVEAWPSLGGRSDR
jgi:hypothetical protein